MGTDRFEVFDKQSMWTLLGEVTWNDVCWHTYTHTQLWEVGKLWWCLYLTSIAVVHLIETSIDIQLLLHVVFNSSLVYDILLKSSQPVSSYYILWHLFSGLFCSFSVWAHFFSFKKKSNHNNYCVLNVGFLSSTLKTGNSRGVDVVYMYLR